MTERPVTETVTVGYIAKAHGLRGEVIVRLTTDRTERLDPGTELTTDGGQLTVDAAAPHGDRWRVHFVDVETREQAEGLRGTELRAEPLVDTGEVFVHELVGLPVVLGDGTAVADCVAVIDNPAHDLLELADGRLVPYVFVTSVDDRGIVIDPPDGLLEL